MGKYRLLMVSAFALLLFSGLAAVSAQEPVSMELETSREKYRFGETVVLTARVTGIDFEGNVTFQVMDSTMLPVLVLTAPLDPNGTASVSFVLTEQGFPKGRYDIYASVKTESTFLFRSTFITVHKDVGKKEGGPFQMNETTIIAGAIVGGLLIGTAAVIGGTEAGAYGFSRIFVAPMYSRLNADDVRDQETRGRILGFLTAQPGAHYNEIKRELDLKNGTAAYHLERLEKEGLIISQKQGIYRVFYLSKTQERVLKRKKVGKRYKAILDHVIGNPGSTQKEISAGVGIKQNTVSYNLIKMERVGKVRSEKADGVSRYYPGEEISASTPKDDDDEMTNEKRLQLLEDRFLKGEMSEETYNRLKGKYED